MTGTAGDARSRRGPAADVIRSESAQVLRDEVASVTPHEVTPVSPTLDGLVGLVEMPTSQLVFVRYGGNVLVEAPPTGDRVVATIPLGPMHVTIGEGAERVREQGFILGEDARTLMRPDPWAGALVVAVDVDHLREHRELVFGSEKPVPIGENPELFLTHASRQAWSASATLGSDTPTDVVWQFLTVLEDQLLTALVLSWNRSDSDPVNPGGSRVAELREWLDANHGPGISVSDMARHLGLSVRQLQFIVQSRTGMSPSQLLREIRLAKARDMLGAADPDEATVARVAHACGFAHLGRFSQYYRARFGESPSTHLKRSS